MNELINNEGWRVVIHKAEEGGYWGEVPAMPGCSSFGSTREECRDNVIEAAQGCLEVREQEGDPFFQEPNASHLRRAIANLDAKKNVVYHDLIEAIIREP